MWMDCDKAGHGKTPLNKLLLLLYSEDIKRTLSSAVLRMPASHPSIHPRRHNLVRLLLSYQLENTI